MDGIILINKEKKYTSHDVVAKVKTILKVKVGHTGTLDPNATGILPLLLGNATKISKYLINHNKEYIAELKDSKTVLVAYNTNDPDAGMSNTRDLSRFKLFLSDTGLFVTLMFKDKDFTENEIYEKLLNDRLSVNLGYLYENIVAQCLAANGNELFYHTIMNKNSKHNYEIDFILARKNKIIPIEVKSSGYKTHKSLDVFTEKYSRRILKRYLIYTKDMSKDQDIFCVPVYMVPFL